MIQSVENLIRSPAYRLALSIALLCMALQYAGLAQFLRFDRAAIDSGQWWLLLTGNFVHLGPSHLWMNLAGLALVVALLWQHYSAAQWALLIVLASVVVGVGLWRFNPEIQGYVGFSGTLHGLILAGVLADLRSYPRSAGILLLLVIGKLVWEQFAGALPGSESVAGGLVVVDSHLYGALAGTILGALMLATGFSNHPVLPPESESDTLSGNSDRH